MTDTADWRMLASQSEAARNNALDGVDGVPAIHRSLPQVVEQTARVYREKRSHAPKIDDDALSKATRLLAAEGVDLSSLHRRATAELDLHAPMDEDPFPVTRTLEDFIRQNQETARRSTLREARRNAARGFENFMDDCLSQEARRSELSTMSSLAPLSRLHGVAPPGASPAPGRGGATPYRAGYTPASFHATPGALSLSARTPMAAALPASSVEGGAAANLLRATAQLNSDVGLEPGKATQTMCGARLREEPPKAVRRCWDALRGIVGGLGTRAVDEDRAMALVRGARRLLERQYLDHVDSKLRNQLETAQVGSSRHYGKLAELDSYMHLRYPRDNADPSPDAKWHLLFLCLRCGLADEARRVKDEIQSPELTHFDEWLRRGCVEQSEAERLAETCQRVVSSSLQDQRNNVWRLLVLTVMSGMRDAHKRFLDHYADTMFSTIEDFLWFKLAMCRALDPAPGDWPSPGGGHVSTGSPTLAAGSGGAGRRPQYTVRDMQADINRWPEEHYTRKGRDPLLYVWVLLLTMQPHAALDYLKSDSGAARSHSEAELDAVHMAYALHVDGALAALPPVANVNAAAGALTLRPWELVWELAQDYARRIGDAEAEAVARHGLETDNGPGPLGEGERGSFAAAAALEYAVAASKMAGTDCESLGALLQRLVTVNARFGATLGLAKPTDASRLVHLENGVDGALKRLRDVAERCEKQAQHDAAVGLYLAAREPRPALKLLSMKISNLVASRQSDQSTLTSTAEFNDLCARGEEAMTQLRELHRAPPSEAECFAALFNTAHVLCNAAAARLGGAGARAKWQAANDRLREMARFVPTPHGSDAQVEECRRAVASHQHLRAHIKDVLVAAGEATYELARDDRGRAIQPADELTHRRLELLQRLASELREKEANRRLQDLKSRLSRLTGTRAGW
ncbi:unnamed protein product [Pedinophyceae sp. YPF-701]|nr:unnamed protein product [Pedinophyceae sp. YPF-701]